MSVVDICFDLASQAAMPYASQPSANTTAPAWGNPSIKRKFKVSRQMRSSPLAPTDAECVICTHILLFLISPEPSTSSLPADTLQLFSSINLGSSASPAPLPTHITGPGTMTAGEEIHLLHITFTSPLPSRHTLVRR